MKSAILKQPATILAGVAVGVFIGLFNGKISGVIGIDNFANVISFPGQLYLFFLQMTVIPIIITAISSSLGKLMRNKSSAGLIKKTVIVFLICMVICAAIGMVAGIFGKPGAGLNEDTRSLLSKLLSSEQRDSGILEINLGSSQDVTSGLQRPGISHFFASLIPANIFHALSLGSVMAILFFSIIFGVAIGFLPDDSAALLINLCTAIFQAFQKLISWSLYLLPFGLVCLLAGQIASVGVQIFVAMSKFIILYILGTAALFIICTVIIWLRSGIRNPFKVISVLFEPILLAFATRNSMATLPSAINCLDKELKFNSNAVNLTLPLGMTLGRFGNIFYFALGVFFIAQIYYTSFVPVQYLIIFVGVIFAGTATAGASGIVTLSMLSIVLDPLHLPMEAVLVIFMAIDPIIDPFRTFLIVYVNMAATALIAGRSEAENQMPEKPKKQLLVYLQEIKNRPPLFYRSNKTPDGFEVSFLKEIGRRMNREIVFIDALSLPEIDRDTAMLEADIIAGVITKTREAPIGFFFSESWALATANGMKKTIHFLLAEGSPEAAEVNNVLKTLKSENFIKSLVNTAN
jgi:proton glutamate symport protein